MSIEKHNCACRTGCRWQQHHTLPCSSRLQDRLPVTGKPEKLMDLKGTDLLGLPVKVRPGRCAWSCIYHVVASGLIV